MMQARDATGRQVSLLNDDGNALRAQRPQVQRPTSYHSTNHILSQPISSSRSSSSSPITPELLRSDSYDSQMSSNGALSPMTPSVDFSFSRTALYPINSEYAMEKRPVYADSSRAASYDDDSAPTTPAERPGKRYPCRFRESHGCEKTFTTSGHASRHSKIHTAEKAVQCTFTGCTKKFTRADNMKQHLETHYKDKARSSGPRAQRAALAEARRNSHTARNRSVVRDTEAPQWKGEQYPLPTPPLPSSGGAASGAWDMRPLNLPLMSRPSAARTPSSGLDALAMAVACQESGGP
ncbi:hypothetical protein N3K66_005420 [Trichothecium roseum]|uniref:Uncharacterized protein n=1 Tax=Trichothecium roseum TaxID=47278 RepID=A0ACC0UXT7_9HYPO|nr:hypothetical protein N3K66_005420 [Trichothecium roseum]